MTTLNMQKAVIMTTLPKLYVKNLELSKYTRYRILIPYDNINVHLTGVNGKKVSPHKSQTWIQ